jgi:hypothetical protein
LGDRPSVDVALVRVIRVMSFGVVWKYQRTNRPTLAQNPLCHSRTHKHTHTLTHAPVRFAFQEVSLALAACVASSLSCKPIPSSCLAPSAFPCFCFVLSRAAAPGASAAAGQPRFAPLRAEGAGAGAGCAVATTPPAGGRVCAAPPPACFASRRRAPRPRPRPRRLARARGRRARGIRQRANRMRGGVGGQ